LKDVIYYENPVGSRNQNEKAACDIERLYAAMDILDLFNGKIRVSKVSLHDGNINLVRYPDSTLNLLNAFKSSEQKFEGFLPDSPGTEPDHDMDLHLEQIYLSKIQIRFDDRVENDKEALQMNKLRASFSSTPELIRSEVETEMDLQMVRLSEKILFSNKELSLETAFRFRREAGILQIAPSKLSIGQAMMNISGDIDFNQNDKFNIQVDGSDKDFSLFQMVLSREGLRNLKEGDMYFRGDIIGTPGQEIPVADLAFGLEDVTLYVPRAKDYIRDLNLSGNFHSGSKGDLSAAILDVDTVLAKLPAGHLNAVFHLENFMSPEIDVIWDMEGLLSGLEKILKTELFDSLSGKIDTECKLLGARFDPDSNHIVADVFTFDINCKDLSISIPDVISVQKINGKIYNDRDTTWFEDLDVRTGDTDFLINGIVYHAIYLPANVEHEIKAELRIQSGIFDMPEFLSFVPAIWKDFPHRIKDIDLDVVLSTSTQKMLDFEKNPDMDFDIRHLDATIEHFLPRITDLSGNFILDEKYHRTFMDFNDFEFGMLESSISADLELHSPANKRSYIMMDVQTRDLNPGEIFFGEAGDSIPDFLNGLLNASFQLDIHFPHDESTRLEKVDLREADLHFVNITDTFETRSLNMHAADIYWNNDPANKLLESLDAGIQLSMDRLETDYFEIENLEYIMDIHNGVFKIGTEKARVLSKAGTAEYLLAPFAEVPYYELTYKVEGVEVSEILTTLKADTLISGNMDVYIDLSSEGRNREELLHSLNGEVSLYGEDLLLYGIDLDEVIKKFKRSQNFNLVDLGAVMVAGPVGLAVTKGGSYAAMLVTNFGDSSHVTEIVSDWQLENETIILRDVAFSTEESRVAVKGWLDFQRDSLDISFAVIDKRGCSIIGQDLYGHIKDPQKSPIKLVATLLAPVTNLVEISLGIDCEPFYEGRIKHPIKKQ
jgi:AsmA protein